MNTQNTEKLRTIQGFIKCNTYMHDPNFFTLDNPIEENKIKAVAHMTLNKVKFNRYKMYFSIV